MGLDRDAGALLLDPVRRARRRPRRRDRGGDGGLRGGRRQGGASPPTTPTRASCSSQARRAALPAPRGARGAAARGRRRADPAAAGPARRASRRSPRAHDVEIPVVAHAGDGNTHPAIIYDPPATRTPSAGPALAFDEIMATAIELGGTITGEHGVGRLKAGSCGPARPRRHGPDPPGQGRPRPARHPQPRRRLLTRAGPWTAAAGARHPEGTAPAGAPTTGGAVMWPYIIGFIVIVGVIVVVMNRQGVDGRRAGLTTSTPSVTATERPAAGGCSDGTDRRAAAATAAEAVLSPETPCHGAAGQGARDRKVDGLADTDGPHQGDAACTSDSASSSS